MFQHRIALIANAFNVAFARPELPRFITVQSNLSLQRATSTLGSEDIKPR